ncbi:MAG TPA: tripartite tricarboxylate transporter substrate binding protein [Xanthobacteraceae bacterium]|jgi:tripartite-type tricarboxylate transporter receptor subunit TctC|nr:tripartite tricarboxylate transporter substrate binding protein [Xanthobacteraceae bacterium]
MIMQRRKFLLSAAVAIAAPAICTPAWAQEYPTRPVRIIVGFAAGGASDITARLMGQWLSERLGQPFIIENRPGANTNIAAEAAITAAADGYTLLFTTVSNAVNATLYENLRFKFVRDTVPVAGIALGTYVMVVNPSVPARTVPQLIAYTKDNLDKVSMASAGIGSGPHVAGELFKTMTGARMVHVPYRGDAPALTDLLGGQVQLYFSALPPSIEYIRAGKLRALAVTTVTRSDALPDISSMKEFVPGYEANQWQGLSAPRGTPNNVIDKLNKEINSGLLDPKIKARIADLGSTVFPGSPAAFGKLIAEDTEKWGKVIRAANIKPE